jgi:hypothetical protein
MRMNSSEVLEVGAGIGVLIAGFSWAYWLRAIVLDVNSTLPDNQRVTKWNLTENPPRGTRVHLLWKRHIELFPKSRKRAYAAVSLILTAAMIIIASAASLLLPS